MIYQSAKRQIGLGTLGALALLMVVGSPPVLGEGLADGVGVFSVMQQSKSAVMGVSENVEVANAAKKYGVSFAFWHFDIPIWNALRVGRWENLMRCDGGSHPVFQQFAIMIRQGPW
jgi:hypothetical protein